MLARPRGPIVSVPRASNMADYLNRYTSLSVLLDLLSKRRIACLSPKKWEDRNDQHYMARYKKR